MKKCPKCKEICPEDANCCPYCGEEFASDNHSGVIGSDNTFTGGVHTTNTTTKTGSDNVTQTNSNNTTTTNNTTIYEAKKSDSDLLKENLRAFRLECKMRYKNGLISKEDQDYLREIQRTYGLADEIAAPIKEEIRQLSRERTTKLTLTVISGIGKTKSIIELNSSSAIQSHLMQLESWMREYDDDSLESWYYQLSSMLKPVAYTESYEQSTKDEFWQVYWAYIAYMLQNKAQQAYDARALLGRFETSYLEPNDEVLGLAGRLILNEPIEDIKKDYKAGAIHCSKELQLLLETIDELLQKRWSRETNVRPVHSFYADILFKSFVDSQIEVGKKQREEEERISREERQRQEEITRQKGYLLQRFESVEDIDKACAELGIPYFTFQGWIEEDSTFSSKYNAIVRRIEDRRKEEAEKILIAQETEARIKQQKSQFIQLYGQNDCDFIKTCSDLGIGSDSVKMWRGGDKAFDDSLTTIEREHEKKLQDIFIQFYESSGCDLQKASAETGVSVDDVNSWRKSNRSFNEVLISIENEYVQAQKDAFVKCYEDNKCDLSTTCHELGLEASTFREWQDSDHIFAERISFIETAEKKRRKAEEDRINKELCKKRWGWFIKKCLPVLLIAALSVFVVIKIVSICNDRMQAKDALDKLVTERNELVKAFDAAYKCVTVEDDPDVFNESLMRIEHFLSQISEKETQIIEKDVRKSGNELLLDSLSCKVQLLCKDLDSSLNLKSLTHDNNVREAYLKKIEFLDSFKKKLESISY